MEKTISTNITLPGYSHGSVLEFSHEFERIINELEQENCLGVNFTFKKQAVQVKSNAPIPMEILEGMLPEVTYIEENLGITITYQHPQKRLLAKADNIAHSNLLEELVIMMLNYQANMLKALGYNYEAVYQFEEELSILRQLKEKLSTTKIQQKPIISTNINFSYEDGDYKKTYKIIDGKSGLRITANYHYDKFKSVKSGVRIREFAIEEIKKSFNASVAEFGLLSDEIACL